MKEYLTDIEKRILFSAIDREKKVCEEVDKESCGKTNEINLTSVCKSLSYKFSYDRMLKQIRKDTKNETLDELLNIVSSKEIDFDSFDDFISFLKVVVDDIKKEN